MLKKVLWTINILPARNLKLYWCRKGDLVIDPIYISYFDTESESYKRAEIPGTTITVSGDAPVVQTQQSSGEAAVEKIKIDQIGYIPKNDGYFTLRLKKEHIYISLAVMVILSLIVLAVFAILKGKKKEDKNLREMYKRIDNSRDKNEIYGILNDVIKNHFNISMNQAPRLR